MKKVKEMKKKGGRVLQHTKTEVMKLCWNVPNSEGRRTSAVFINVYMSIAVMSIKYVLVHTTSIFTNASGFLSM